MARGQRRDSAAAIVRALPSAILTEGLPRAGSGQALQAEQCRSTPGPCTLVGDTGDRNGVGHAGCDTGEWREI